MPLNKLVINQTYRDAAYAAIRAAFNELGVATSFEEVGRNRSKWAVYVTGFSKYADRVFAKVAVYENVSAIHEWSLQHHSYSHVLPCLSEQKLKKRAEAIARRIVRKYPQMIQENL